MNKIYLWKIFSCFIQLQMPMKNVEKFIANEGATFTNAVSEMLLHIIYSIFPWASANSNTWQLQQMHIIIILNDY